MTREHGAEKKDTDDFSGSVFHRSFVSRAPGAHRRGKGKPDCFKGGRSKPHQPERKLLQIFACQHKIRNLNVNWLNRLQTPEKL